MVAPRFETFELTLIGTLEYPMAVEAFPEELDTGARYFKDEPIMNESQGTVSGMDVTCSTAEYNYDLDGNTDYEIRFNLDGDDYFVTSKLTQGTEGREDYWAVDATALADVDANFAGMWFNPTNSSWSIECLDVPSYRDIYVEVRGNVIEKIKPEFIPIDGQTITVNQDGLLVAAGGGSGSLPAAPSTDGTYTLQVVVSNGTATYSWVSLQTASGQSF